MDKKTTIQHLALYMHKQYWIYESKIKSLKKRFILMQVTYNCGTFSAAALSFDPHEL